MNLPMNRYFHTTKGPGNVVVWQETALHPLKWGGQYIVTNTGRIAN